MPERTEYAHGTPSWVDLATTDVAGAESFYNGVLGWDAERMPAGDGVYSMQRIRGTDAAGIYEQPEDWKAGGMPPSWTTYISVDDVDATTAKVAPAGGKVMTEPFDLMDVGRMSVIRPGPWSRCGRQKATLAHALSASTGPFRGTSSRLPMPRSRGPSSKKSWGHPRSKPRLRRLHDDDGRWCPGCGRGAACRRNARDGFALAGLFRSGRL